MIIKNQLDLIGNTPMILLKHLSKKVGCNIYLKLEKNNLSGSLKDRAIKHILLNAIKEKRINNNTTIIEATSGNTGISLACICAILNLKCILVMPKNTNQERVNLIKIYGADIIFSSPNEKMKGSVKKAREIASKIKDSFMPLQFDNLKNAESHYLFTANEIIEDLPNIDGFIHCYGSSGSLSGISKKLKEYNTSIKSISVILDDKEHKIPGIYSNIVSKNHMPEYIDSQIKISEIEVYNMVKQVANKEGITIGLSSAVSLCGACKYLKRNKLKNIVILCNDGIDRYLSNQYLFGEEFDISNDLEKMKILLFKDDFNYEEDDVFYKYKISKKSIVKIKNELLLDAKSIYENDPASINVKQVIDTYLSFFAIFSYRIAHYLAKNNQKVLARKISEYAHSKTSIDIHPEAKIGKSFCIDHGSGIVIGQTCIIGDNVRIYQGVTLGTYSLDNIEKLRNKKRHPTIKNNVIIYAGASILGANTIIGNNVIVGSNVFLTNSVEDNKIVTLTNKNYIIKEKKI